VLSKEGKYLKRFDHLLRDLPAGCIFDGEIVVIDEASRPWFNSLIFGWRAPVHVAFDVLIRGWPGLACHVAGGAVG
jgi:ATP-dependent DNA ligase